MQMAGHCQDVQATASGTSAAGIPTPSTPWQDEVRAFILRNYAVKYVNCTKITILFSGHRRYLGFDVFPYRIYHNSIRNTFSRKKDPRKPTDQMLSAFQRLKELETSGHLVSFPQMPLRNGKNFIQKLIDSD